MRSSLAFLVTFIAHTVGVTNTIYTTTPVQPHAHTDVRAGVLADGAALSPRHMASPPGSALPLHVHGTRSVPDLIDQQLICADAFNDSDLHGHLPSLHIGESSRGYFLS